MSDAEKTDAGESTSRRGLDERAIRAAKFLARGRVGSSTAPFEGKDAYLEILKEVVHGRDMGVADVVALRFASELLGAGKDPYQSRGVDWTEVGGRASEQGLTYGQRLEMYRRARKFVRNDPMAGNLQRLMLAHMMGRGFEITLRSDDGKEHPMVNRLKVYYERDGGPERFFRKVFAHVLINGTMYLVHLPLDGEKGLGRPRCRIVLPDRLQDTIEGDRWAVNSVTKALQFDCLSGEVKDGWMPGDAVTPCHILADWDDGQYGLSFYYWLLKEMPRYIDHMNIREDAARAEAMMLFVRYLKNLEGGTFREVPMKSGVMDAHMEAEKYEVLQRTGGARDAQADADEIRNRLTQGQPFPAPMLTGDLRLAAQLGVMGFPTQVIELFQMDFEPCIKEGVAKRIGCKPDDVVPHWPFVDMRERSKVITELVQMSDKKLIDRRVVHRRAGYDHTDVEAGLAKEKADSVAQAGQIAGVSEQSPLGRTIGLPEAPGVVPQTPISLPSSTTESPNVELSLPAGLWAAEDPWVSFEITKTGEIEGEMFAGLDAGYAGGGALAIGGTSGMSIVTIGELTAERLPVSGPNSWVAWLTKLKDQFPRLNTIYVSKDDPELIDAVTEAGFHVVGVQESEEESQALIEQYIEDGGRLEVNEVATRVIGDLDPGERDAKAGMHLGGGRHHRDAWRYMVVGHLKEAAGGRTEERT